MMNTTSAPPVTPQVLDQLNTSLKRARTFSGEFTNLLRKAYQQDESILADGTLKYRRRLYSEGIMYGSDVYPRSLALVKEVKGILEYYTSITFDEFADNVEDIRDECLDNSKKAKQSQLAHTFVLANLKRIQNEMTQELNMHRNRGVELRRDAASNREKAANSQNVGVGVAAASASISPLVGMFVAPIDGGITTLVLTAIATRATINATQMNAKAVRQETEANAAYQNATALGHLIHSVEFITEAIDIVAQFMALLANELEGIGDIGVGQALKKMHWSKMTNKAKNLVVSCNDFIAIEPNITSDMLSIKEELEHGYSQTWKRGFEVYVDKHTIK
jgi:hypothetical protein